MPNDPNLQPDRPEATEVNNKDAQSIDDVNLNNDPAQNSTDEKVDIGKLKKRSNELREQIAQYVVETPSPTEESPLDALQKEYAELQAVSDKLSKTIKQLVAPRDELKTLTNESRAIKRKTSFVRIKNNICDRVKAFDRWSILPLSWELDPTACNQPTDDSTRLNTIDAEVQRIVSQAAMTAKTTFTEPSEVQEQLSSLCQDFKTNEIKKTTVKLGFADRLLEHSGNPQVSSIHELLEELKTTDTKWKAVTGKATPIASPSAADVSQTYRSDQVLYAELRQLTTRERHIRNAALPITAVIAVITLIVIANNERPDNSTDTSSSGLDGGEMVIPQDFDDHDANGSTAWIASLAEFRQLAQGVAGGNEVKVSLSAKALERRLQPLVGRKVDWPLCLITAGHDHSRFGCYGVFESDESESDESESDESESVFSGIENAIIISITCSVRLPDDSKSHRNWFYGMPLDNYTQIIGNADLLDALQVQGKIDSITVYEDKGDYTIKRVPEYPDVPKSLVRDHRFSMHNGMELDCNLENTVYKKRKLYPIVDGPLIEIKMSADSVKPL